MCTGVLHLTAHMCCLASLKLKLQKVLFLHTAEGVAGTLRPYWSEATMGRASVVQAQPDMLEIVPAGSSKGSGVRMLLDHFGVTPNEVLYHHILFLINRNYLFLMKHILCFYV